MAFLPRRQGAYLEGRGQEVQEETVVPKELQNTYVTWYKSDSKCKNGKIEKGNAASTR